MLTIALSRSGPHARAPSLVLQSAPVLRNPPRFQGKTVVAWTSTRSPPTFHTLLCRSVPPPASAGKPRALSWAAEVLTQLLKSREGVGTTL